MTAAFLKEFSRGQGGWLVMTLVRPNKFVPRSSCLVRNHLFHLLQNHRFLPPVLSANIQASIFPADRCFCLRPVRSASPPGHRPYRH